MSFILEALKKSERERQSKSVPTLQAHHTLPPCAPAQYKRGKIGKGIFFGVLLLLPAIGAPFLFKSNLLPVSFEFGLSIKQPETETPTASTGEKKHPSQAPQPVLPLETPSAEMLPAEMPPVEVAVPADKAEMVPKPTETAITYQPAPILPADPPLNRRPIVVIESKPPQKPSLPNLPFLNELPAEVLAELPELKYAGHTYSNSPDLRMIIINNSIKKEGEPIMQGLRLEEITWDGVVLNYRGKKFQVITTR